MDRRQFCVSSAAALSFGATVALARGGGAKSARRLAPATVDRVVVDSRFPAGRAFGHAAGLAGLPVEKIDGDVTATWLRDLRPHWTAGGGAVAGMTSVPALFTLEQMAKDFWLQVVVRAEHIAAAGRLTMHRLTAPAAAMPGLVEICHTDEAWPERLANALIGLPTGDSQASVRRHVASAGTMPLPAPPAGLVSWIIYA